MSGPAIRVLLLEDHTAFRQAMALILGREPDLAVVAEAGSLAEARPHLRDVDVGVFDLDLPDGDGADLIRELHAANRRAEALVLTASAGRRDLARAVAAGAAGVLHKSTPIAEIVAAIRRVQAGESLISPEELGALLQEGAQQRAADRTAREAIARLTGREQAVLALLAEGLGDKEIAGRLGVRPETVKTHTANLFGKLGVESRLQALILAVRHGVVRLEPPAGPRP